MTREARRRRERAGRWAETAAVWWLRLHGWRIVARRLRCTPVEVDIVAVRGDVLAFVEVKYRRTLDSAAMAVDPRAVARLRQAAAAHGPRLAVRHGATSIRCDLIATAPFMLPRHVAKIH